MHEIRHALIVLAVIGTGHSSLFAQAQSRPTDPPLVTAVNESWYRLREPVQFAGELYYPAGAAVFFNGNTMVRTGHYNGVPVYADATVEPFSVILVPISSGLMQPYERLRRGELAGTTGSRPPAFPVRAVPESSVTAVAPVSPTAAPLPPGAIGVYTPEVPARSTEVTGTTGFIAAPRQLPPPPMVSLRRPEGNDGVWIQFGGNRWVTGGAAIPIGTSDLIPIGEYAGFPVYARRQGPQDIIYLPTRPGFVAPYRRKN